MTMTVRQLMTTLNYMPQDMLVDTGSITITPENMIRFVDQNLEQPEETFEWSADDARDEIQGIIESHDEYVVESILNWFGENIYSEHVALMLDLVRRAENNRGAALILLSELDDTWVSYLDLYIDEIFASLDVVDDTHYVV